jgi:hypothetical protein
MKRNKPRLKVVNRISKRESLPLLRGMFVSPEKADRVPQLAHRNHYYSRMAEDGLFLTAEEGLYLGG